MTKHFKKIATAITIVLTLNFIVPTYSQAMTFTGILMKPFTALIGGFLDVINGFMTVTIIGISNGFSGEKISAERMVEKIQDDKELDKYQNVQKYKVKIDTTNGVVAEKEIEVHNTGGILFLSMEDFFLGNIDLANINIFSNINKGTTAVKAIKKSVAQWYYSLRNLAAVGLLCALIYTVIRILLSTIASDQAHYKEQLIDWLKATSLVIFGHVLMIFILWVTDQLTILISTGTTQYSLIEYARSSLSGNWSDNQLGYLIMYGMLTYYTICFAFSYFRRFLYTLVLIIIAPIVSLMYAFGKQGKEIFSKWIKEFTCNALLQPYHLLIYTVLFGFVGKVLETSEKELWPAFGVWPAVLAIIIAHFIRDAEKYFRSLFGMGSGIAGVGAMDTGEKKLKDIGNKIANAAKSVAQVGAIAVGGGLAASVGSIANNAGNATASALEGTRGLEEAQNPDGTPPRTDDTPEPPSDGTGGSSGDEPEPPEPTGGSGEDGTEPTRGSGGDGTESSGDSGGDESGSSGGSGGDESGSSGGSGGDSSPSDEKESEDSDSSEIIVRKVEDSIDVDTINADEVKVDNVEADNVDAKNQQDIGEKLNTRLPNAGDYIDALAGTNIFGNTQRALDQDSKLKAVDASGKQRAFLGADAALNGNMLGDNGNKDTATLGKGAPTRSQDGDGEVKAKDIKNDNEVKLESGGSFDKDALKNLLEKNNLDINKITDSDIDKISKAVAERTGKSHVEVKEGLTKAMPIVEDKRSVSRAREVGEARKVREVEGARNVREIKEVRVDSSSTISTNRVFSPSQAMGDGTPRRRGHETPSLAQAREASKGRRPSPSQTIGDGTPRRRNLGNKNKET